MSHDRNDRKNRALGVWKTRHAQTRCQQRGVSDRGLELAYEYGERFYTRAGCSVFYLSNKALNAAKGPPSDLIRFRRLCVIVNGLDLITCYRRDRPDRRWKGAR